MAETTYIKAITHALATAMRADRRVFVLGEDVGQQLVRDRAVLGHVAAAPQVLLQAVEAGELHALLDDLLATVDLRVEVAKGLRHRLDAFVGDA